MVLLYFVKPLYTPLFLVEKKRLTSVCINCKGLAILGNIVAETLLRMQMFPSLAARGTCVAETNFAARKTKKVFAWSQKHFCFTDTNFASEIYVSQFSHPGKHYKKHFCQALKKKEKV